MAPVPLPEQNATVEAGTRCQVAGWGTRRRRGRLSRVPRVLNVTVTPANQCRPNNVCTGVLTRRGGICQVPTGCYLVWAPRDGGEGVLRGSELHLRGEKASSELTLGLSIELELDVSDTGA